MKKLRTLLEKCSYKGSELENDVLASNELYTFEKLSAKIQASDGELKDGLKEIGAFQLDGEINKKIYCDVSQIVIWKSTFKWVLRVCVITFLNYLIVGYWRVLEFEYECRALSFVLNLIDEQSWPYNTVPMDETLKILGELLPPVILQHIIDQYSTCCFSSNLSKYSIFFYK